jgi:hypothetical protein
LPWSDWNKPIDTSVTKMLMKKRETHKELIEPVINDVMMIVAKKPVNASPTIR